MQQDPWAAFPDAAPDSPPFAPRPVYRQRAPEPAPVRPVQQATDEVQLDRLRNPRPAPQTSAQARKDRAEADGAELDLQQKRIKARTVQKDLADTRAEVVKVLDHAFRAKEIARQGWGAVGFGAETLSNIGGTPAADLEGVLSTIGSNTAFDRLQRMRAESPTGGALGNVAVPELELLKNTIAPLRQKQSPDQFQGSMQNVVNAYGRILMKLPGGRAIAKERGWIGGGKAKPQRATKPKVIDFNDLPE